MTGSTYLRAQPRSGLRLSRFLADLLGTAVTQAALVGLSLVLVRIIAGIVTEREFGVFMVSRRVVGVLAPLTTLNLGIGLARYLAFQPDRRRVHAWASIWIVSGLSLVALIVLVAASDYWSGSIFGDRAYPEFVVLIACTLAGTNAVGLVSDIYRGRREMGWANGIQLAFFTLPLPLIPLALALAGGRSRSFLGWHLGLTAVLGALLGAAFFRLGPARERPLGYRAVHAADVRSLVAYSVSRSPSSFLLGLVFAWPVLLAGRSGSLELAARVGILSTLVRLMETWSYPFNLIVLPRFAAMRAAGGADEVRGYASLILDFIVSTMPLLGALSFGLGGSIVALGFGPKYVDLTHAASWVLLGSTAYVAFVLIRGVLDGVHGFPYVNVVSVLGLASSGAVVLIAGSTSLGALGGALVTALVAMGAASIALLVWTTGANVPARTVALGLVLGVPGLLVSTGVDGALAASGLGTAFVFAVQLFVRAALVGAAYVLVWRRSTPWGAAVWRRTWG